MASRVRNDTTIKSLLFPMRTAICPMYTSTEINASEGNYAGPTWRYIKLERGHCAWRGFHLEFYLTRKHFAFYYFTSHANIRHFRIVLYARLRDMAAQLCDTAAQRPQKSKFQMYGELDPSLIRLGMIVSVHWLTTSFSLPCGAETAVLARLPAGVQWVGFNRQ